MSCSRKVLVLPLLSPIPEQGEERERRLSSSRSRRRGSYDLESDEDVLKIHVRSLSASHLQDRKEDNISFEDGGEGKCILDENPDLRTSLSSGEAFGQKDILALHHWAHRLKETFFERWLCGVEKIKIWRQYKNKLKRAFNAWSLVVERAKSRKILESRERFNLALSAEFRRRALTYGALSRWKESLAPTLANIRSAQSFRSINAKRKVISCLRVHAQGRTRTRRVVERVVASTTLRLQRASFSTWLEELRIAKRRSSEADRFFRMRKLRECFEYLRISRRRSKFERSATRFFRSRQLRESFHRLFDHTLQQREVRRLISCADVANTRRLARRCIRRLHQRVSEREDSVRLHVAAGRYWFSLRAQSALRRWRLFAARSTTRRRRLRTATERIGVMVSVSARRKTLLAWLESSRSCTVRRIAHAHARKHYERGVLRRVWSRWNILVAHRLHSKLTHRRADCFRTEVASRRALRRWWTWLLERRRVIASSRLARAWRRRRVLVRCIDRWCAFASSRQRVRRHDRAVILGEKEEDEVEIDDDGREIDDDSLRFRDGLRDEKGVLIRGALAEKWSRDLLEDNVRVELTRSAEEFYRSRPDSIVPRPSLRREPRRNVGVSANDADVLEAQMNERVASRVVERHVASTSRIAANTVARPSCRREREYLDGEERSRSYLRLTEGVYDKENRLHLLFRPHAMREGVKPFATFRHQDRFRFAPPSLSSSSTLALVEQKANARALHPPPSRNLVASLATQRSLALRSEIRVLTHRLKRWALEKTHALKERARRDELLREAQRLRSEGVDDPTTERYRVILREIQLADLAISSYADLRRKQRPEMQRIFDRVTKLQKLYQPVDTKVPRRE